MTSNSSKAGRHAVVPPFARVTGRRSGSPNPKAQVCFFLPSSHWLTRFLDTWQLYNLDEDPGETVDLAEKYPEKVEELLKAWADYCEACGVIPLQPELGTYILATEEQMPVCFCLL